MLQWKNGKYKRATRALFLGAIFFVGASFCLPARPAAAQANTSTLAEGVAIIQEPLGLPTTDIRVIIANIIKVALGLLGLILVALIIYGGFLWMTAGGNEEQITTAKNVLKNAVIGLIIILLSYGIVLFVIRLLGVGTGPGADTGLGAPARQNFQGSGALGGIIKDHYPERDQIDVPRNTKILITFRRPIRPDSLVDDSNKNGTFGDCINIGANLIWERDCDHLKLSASQVEISEVQSGRSIKGAVLLAQYEQGKVFTVVIRPFETLGSAAAPVAYKVRVGNQIYLDDPANQNPAIFSARPVGNQYYEWKFTCSTALDLSPPTVVSTFPNRGGTAAKNSVIQIDFSEPMDPTGIQGQFKSEADYYVLDGIAIFLKSGASTIPEGSFRLLNGYKTLEFTPSVACGTNACGGQMYCLPVCDAPQANCREDNYQTLVRAGAPVSVNSFEAVPFSGAMDLAGNALDGNANTKVEIADRLAPVFPDQLKPDNYFWNFKILDALDITSPILSQVTPGLDAQFILPSDPWRLTFNKRMRVEPMYSIKIEEQPTPADRGDNIPLCLTPRVAFNEDNSTVTAMSHCPFLDGIRQYYYPVLSSELEDVHFNCFYPGVGPGGPGEAAKRLKVSSVCAADGSNCCQVSSTTLQSAFCCNGEVKNNLQADKSCVEFIRSVSP